MSRQQIDDDLGPPPSLHFRTEHFAIHALYLREKVASGEVQLEWLPTDKMSADMLTKALAGRTKNQQFSSMVGLADCHLEGCVGEWSLGG